MEETTKDKIIAIIAGYLGLQASDITPETTLEQLNTDSLDQIEIIMEVEGVLEVELPDASLAGVKTVGDLIFVVEGVQAGIIAAAPEPTESCACDGCNDCSCGDEPDAVAKLTQALGAAHVTLMHVLQQLGGTLTITRQQALDLSPMSSGLAEELDPVTGDYVLRLFQKAGHAMPVGVQ